MSDTSSHFSLDVEDPNEERGRLGIAVLVELVLLLVLRQNYKGKILEDGKRIMGKNRLTDKSINPFKITLAWL